MGARLQYAKVIDRQIFYVKEGGRVHPGLPNEVLLDEEIGVAGAFLVLRAWCDDHGSFTEQWRIEDPGGMRVYESTPREIYIATASHVEKLEDEVSDLQLDMESDAYRVVFLLDEREVARVRFQVKTSGNGLREK